MVDVDKLRTMAAALSKDGLPNAALFMRESADEIEALRKGLAQIRDMDPVELALDPEWAQRQARALLKGTPNGQG